MHIDFAVIGGQKCGSTLLQNMLSDHPEIAMPSGESAQLEDEAYGPEGLRQLAAQVEPLKNTPCVGIKRPSYLGMPQVADRLIDLNPAMNTIAVLRNPYERIRSAYYHLVNYGLLPVEEFNAGMRNILAGSWRSSYPRADELIPFGLYGKHLKHYRAVFGDRLKIILFDHLRANKLAVLRDTYAWLGVDPDFIPQQKYLAMRAQGVNYSLARARWLRLRLPHAVAFDAERNAMIPLKRNAWDELVNGAIIYADYFLLKHLLGNKKPAIEPDVLAQLRDIYDPDISELEQMLGEDLSRWREQ